MAPPTVTPAGVVGGPVVPTRVTTQDLSRRYYGRGIDLRAIEAAIRSAEIGLMSDLTDLTGEAANNDPSLLSALGKRVLVVNDSPWRLDAARTMDAKDKQWALDMAAALTTVVKHIPRFLRTLRALMWGIYNGRSAAEIHWDRAPTFMSVGRARLSWIPVGLTWIHPRNLSFGPTREVRWIEPNSARGYFNTDGFALDDLPGKFLHWEPQLFNEQPEREGLGPRCAYWSFFKRFSWRMRMLLTELFGIPWRIITAGKDAIVGKDALRSAKAQAEALGAETTAVLEQGLDLEVVMPNGDTGQLFAMNGDDVDRQLTALILGNVGTTYGAPAGLNSNTVGVMKGEQNSIAKADLGELGEVMTDLLRWIVMVNQGPEAAHLLTPSFCLPGGDPPRDRKMDMDLAERASKVGVAVAQAQIREICDVRVPEPGEPLIEPPAAPTFGFGGDQPPAKKKPDAKDDGAVVDGEDDPVDPGDAEEEELAALRRLGLRFGGS